MPTETQNSDFEQRCRAAGVHTIEVAAPDMLGHLRGKRVPIDRFFATTVNDGVNIADAMFIFDMQNDLIDDPYINMGSGFLDCKLIPDVSTGRILTHRPGYALAFADTFDPHGNPHPHAPRGVLHRQIERCRASGLDPVVATELEFYLCTPDWQPVQRHIQYSSLTDGLAIEDCLRDMRTALIGAGLEVESSNAEYGPGQFEINIGHADAMTAADNTVLFKSIVKQVAVAYGWRATFMPKPYIDQSGSGMHVHTSLRSDGVNAFADSDGVPNELMSQWIAGLLEHARSIGLIASPTANGVKRVQPNTFAPTHVHWGLDNRTVLVRCIVEAGSRANRVEFRSAGADANAVPDGRGDPRRGRRRGRTTARPVSDERRRHVCRPWRLCRTAEQSARRDCGVRSGATRGAARREVLGELPVRGASRSSARRRERPGPRRRERLGAAALRRALLTDSDDHPDDHSS